MPPPMPRAAPPVKLNCVTWPTPEKNGVTVARTYRRSADTTARADRFVPSGSVWMIGM